MTLDEWFLERYGEVAPDGNRRIGAASAAGTVVEDVVQTLQMRGVASTTYRAMRLWRHMSDPRVRAHTQGVFLDRSRRQPELVVYVDHSVWLYEFDMLREAILAEWNTLAAANDAIDLQVRYMSFKLSSQARRSGQDGSLSSTQAGSHGGDAPLPPLDAGESAAVDAAVAGITDERLRQQARNAIEMTERRKKAEQM